MIIFLIGLIEKLEKLTLDHDFCLTVHSSHLFGRFRSCYVRKVKNLI